MKTQLGLIYWYIGNTFFTVPCAENICYKCGQEYGARFGAILVLKRSVYFLKTRYNSFHNFVSELLIDLFFTSYQADQYLWLSKSDEYVGYDYIATYADDIIIAAKDSSKYMNEIKQHFQVRNITDSPDYDLGN